MFQGIPYQARVNRQGQPLSKNVFRIQKTTVNFQDLIKGKKAEEMKKIPIVDMNQDSESFMGAFKIIAYDCTTNSA